MSLALQSKRNDAVRELSAILQPLASRWRLMGVLVAYVDESGTHDKRGRQPGSKIAGLAGYVASEREWTLFSKRWNKILKRYQVDDCFHLADFENGKPPYDEWPEKKAERFIDELTAAIRKIRGFGQGAMVDSRAYDAFAPKWMKAWGRGRIDHTYYFSLMGLLEALLDNFPKHLPRNEKLAIIFDRQQQFKGTALKMCEMMSLIRYDGFRIGSVAFSPKADFPPLQAADCLVHWMRRDMEDRIYANQLGARLYFLVPRGRAIKTAFMDEARMHEYVKSVEARRRKALSLGLVGK